MRDGDYRAGILLEMLLEPVDRLSVKVVGRLVEEEDIGLLEKETAEGNSTAFTTREGGYFLVVGRTLERVHRAFELTVDIPCVSSIELILQFSLTRNQGVHLIGIFQHIGVSEGLVDLVKLSEQIHDGLHTFAHNFKHGLVRIELRLLLKVSHRITWREYNFALIFLVDTCYNLEE